MKYLVTLVILFLTLVAGCSQHNALVPSHKRMPVTTMHADTQFSPDERAAIDLAAWKWALQTNGMAQITIVYDLDKTSIISLMENDENNVIIRADSSMELVQAVPEGVLAWVTSQCGGGIQDPCGAPVMMVVVSDRMPESLEQIAMHEFGHVLSMQHVRDANSIMRPAVHVFPEAGVCLKQADISEFCRVWDCGHTQMFPCD